MNKYITHIIKRLKYPNKRYKWLRFIKQNEFKSMKHNVDIQKDLLFNILKYSVNNVPYYQSVSKEENITLNRKNIFENIRKFPVLDKKILRNEFDNLTAENYDGKYFKNTSGGSTGEPAIFLQDRNYFEKGQACKLLFDSWVGKKGGEKKLKLWGSERDILKGGQGWKAKLKEEFLNVKLLNTFRMSEQDMMKFVKEINKFKPKLIEAYVQSIYEFAKFIKNRKIEIYSPEGVITSAGTLYPEMKKLIEEVFNCKVLNRYGSREVGDVACSCNKDRGLHINLFNNYVEILDDNLKPCTPGQMGKIYVTTLNNYSMPLIRYDIGDVAVPSDKICSCGRGLPLIESVKGRTNSIIKTKKGVFDSVAISALLYFYKEGVPFQSFSKYQIIQKSLNKIIFKVIIKDKQRWKDEKKIIKKKFMKTLGKDCKIRWEFVDEIKPTKSGKYQYIISEVD